MKNILIVILALLMSISLFSQNWTPPEHGNTRVGVIGNIWQPVGFIVNHNFGDFGMYMTTKTNVDVDPFEINQYNVTLGLSISIFKNTSKTNYSDLLVGVSYTTDTPDNVTNHSYPWGAEVLLMFPFTDRNFRIIGGWCSNSIVWAEGFTAGFAYQF